MPLAVRAPLSGPGTPRCPAPQLVTNRFTGSAVLYGTPSTKNGIILTQNINTASSSVAKATDDLSSAREQLAGALALVAELDTLLNGEGKLPKDYASQVAQAGASAQQLQRLVKRREASLSEAQSSLRAAEHEAWTAKVNALADKVAAFDQDAFTAEFIAKVQPVVDELLGQVYEVKAAESELRSLTGKEVHPTDRVSFTPDSHRDLIVDGDKVYSLAPQHLVKDLGSKLTDTRYDSSVAKALAEQRTAQAEEQAERAAELKAQREAANISKWGSITPPAAVTKTNRDGKTTFLRR